MNAWRAVAIGLVCLLLLGAGSGLGTWLSARHYRPLLDAANLALAQCKAARGNLEALAAEQGAKLGELTRQAEQRQALAGKAVEQARQQASSDYAAAQRLLRERSDGDDCAAAQAVIDQELGL